MEKALNVMDNSSTGWNGPSGSASTTATSNMPMQATPQMVPQQNPFGMAAAPPMFAHPQPMAQPGMSNPFTLQNALRIMLGGSSSSGSSNGSTGPSGDDSGNLQTALDQKQQAIDACNSISGESDKGVKEGLASQAQDHANASRYAADALYNSPNRSKSQEVRDMASRARSAANTAQSFADRARSKADGGGW